MLFFRVPQNMGNSSNTCGPPCKCNTGLSSETVEDGESSEMCKLVHPGSHFLDSHKDVWWPARRIEKGAQFSFT